MKGAGLFPKTSQRPESEMTENAVECAVCEVDSRPSSTLLARNAWSRTPRT